MANNNSSIYDRLKAEYKEYLRTVQLSAMGNESIPQYLGQLMGEREWNESDTEANKNLFMLMPMRDLRKLTVWF